MSILIPNAISIGDICTAALKECGALGVGQTPLAEDLTDAWARLQFMLMEWRVKRWLVYHLKEYSKVSTGAQSYTVGPGADFDTGGNSFRPERIEFAYLRIVNVGVPNQPDVPLDIIQSMEEYAQVRLKRLSSLSRAVFYDPALPLGLAYCVPIPTAVIYEIHLGFKEQLPFQYATQASTFVLPFEYYSAMYLNLAIRLLPKYGIKLAPGNPLPGLAKSALNTVRGSNTAIKELDMPGGLAAPGLYNIISDESY